MIYFASKIAFIMLIPLLLVLAYILFYRGKFHASFKYSSAKLFSGISPGWRARFVSLPFILKIAAVILMIIGLARPQLANTKVKNNVEGIDIVLLVDLSPTMMIEDMSPYNRLEAAKIAQIEFVKNRPSDRIGIVAFSGEAFTAVPPTLDHKIVIQRLKELNNSENLKQGTAQGVAIATGVARLKDSTAKSRIMVFITDGENNTGTIDPDTALEIAKGYGIRIYTIGVGSDGPKQLPIVTTDPFGRRLKTYQSMTSSFYEEAMEKIANQTGGKYWRSRNNNELKQVYATIDRLEKSKIDSNSYTKYSELFPPYIQWALFLYLMSWLLSNTILRRKPA